MIGRVDFDTTQQQNTYEGLQLVAYKLVCCVVNKQLLKIMLLSVYLCLWLSYGPEDRISTTFELLVLLSFILFITGIWEIENTF